MGDKISKDFVSLILESFYTAAHWLGERIVSLIGYIIPQADKLGQIIDPIGMLAILTILLLIAQVAKRIAWIIVAIGWGLIAIRIVLIALA
jgi:hypothetical protein